MKVISLFSGAGGLDIGFFKAGCKIIWANDIDGDSCETYSSYLGNHIKCEDICDINPKDVPDGDIVIGGFPCLGFTVANINRKVSDKGNMLYHEFLKFLKEKETKYFLVENVPGIRKGLNFKDNFSRMIKEFRNAGKIGYYVKTETLNSANFGVPQKRRRVIILGTRKDIPDRIVHPNPTHAKENWIKIKDAISDLPLEPTGEIPNHVGTKHKVRINGYVGNRPLFWDKPSPTIMGRGSRTGGPVIHPHPERTRRLTVRECARLQSFPDDVIFSGSISSQYAQVGNAVPCLMAFRIAQKIMRDSGERPKKFKASEWKLPWVKNWTQ